MFIEPEVEGRSPSVRRAMSIVPDRVPSVTTAFMSPVVVNELGRARLAGKNELTKGTWPSWRRAGRISSSVLLAEGGSLLLVGSINMALLTEGAQLFLSH